MQYSFVFPTETIVVDYEEGRNWLQLLGGHSLVRRRRLFRYLKIRASEPYFRVYDGDIMPVGSPKRQFNELIRRYEHMYKGNLVNALVAIDLGLSKHEVSRLKALNSVV